MLYSPIYNGLSAAFTFSQSSLFSFCSSFHRYEFCEALCKNSKLGIHEDAQNRGKLTGFLRFFSTRVYPRPGSQMMTCSMLLSMSTTFHHLTTG
ncbi:uncharacterized protein EDB91DRAFT_1144184 [Suillus paluster]|uniref:uncharacterized protein n=1 Tax=Suillus paluster TaxID=48578 RepID=UPI001B8820A6|nr:uncharacterized protein EDB91DRAFT_1144184 [Suillus paluster]KAG1735595.1 hypothetical protein EDB91DRAFT_1144184 [Suillus paluster]